MFTKCMLAWASLCLLLSTSMGWSQTAASPPPPVQSVSPLQGLEGPVRPETLSARRATVASRLETLGQTNVPQSEQEATRAALEQQLKLLTALEDTFRQRDAYNAQLRSLPQRLEELQAERKALEARPTPRFAEVSEQLRDHYENDLQAIQVEIETLRKQHAAAELRLTGMAKEVEQLTIDRGKTEKELLAARGDAAKEAEQKLSLLARVEWLDLKLQFFRAQADTLEAERQWLTKRGPLPDALLGVAKARLKNMQQDLEVIKQALGRELRREQAALTTTAAGIERKLEQTADPAEAMVLAVGLQTVEIRKGTADYRQQSNRVSDRVLAQEKFNSQEKQDVERLASLVERYVSGERVAQRLQVAFARLRREHTHFRDDQIRALEARLQTLTAYALDLDERLYEFDRLAEGQLAALRTQFNVDAAQQNLEVAKVRQALDEQKTALREQQQALAALGQDVTKLLTLYRERKRLLEDSYRFILTKLFWLRDGQPMRWGVAHDAMTGAVEAARRLHAFVQSELSDIVTELVRSVHFWVLILLLFGLLPWGATQVRRRLRAQVRAYIAEDVTSQTLGHKTVSALLMLCQTAVWPTYIAVMLWIWPQLLPQGTEQSEMEHALITGLQMAALFLWLGLLGHAIFRRDGWGQQYAGFKPELCRFLRRVVTMGWLASLLLLVPRHILLTAPGAPENLADNLALARLFFTTFQVLILGLVGITCRRGSCVMQAILADSRRRHGLLWRNWPLVYMGLLAGIGTVIALDIQGYRYAARSLWLRSAEALVVVLVLMAVYSLTSAIIDRLARQRRRPGDQPVDPRQPSRWSLLQQGRHFVRVILMLVGIVAIQHLYGLDQDLFGALDALQLVQIGKGDAGQLLWLTLGDLIAVLLIFAGVALVIRNLPGLYEVVLFPRVRWEAGFRYAFLTLSRYVLLLVAFWWSLVVLHLRWSSIQWILAAASVGLGFGMQEIVSNFVSGLILLVERPISVGDFVAVGGQEGRITRITIRATTIQNVDNQTVLVPNKEFIAGQVTNWTLGDPYVRVVAPVGVAYGSDTELVKRLLTQVVVDHPKVLKYPAPQILFRAFGESSLDWEVWFFVPTPHDRFVAKNDVLLRIDQAFREHGVQIPFPQRDLHLRSSTTALDVRTSGNGQAAERPGVVPPPASAVSTQAEAAEPTEPL